VKAGQAQDTSKGAVDLGGGVEVFPDTAGATARAKYIQAALTSVQMLEGEYDYISGGVLLRVSAVLSPSKATVYSVQLAKLTGLGATLVTK